MGEQVELWKHKIQDLRGRWALQVVGHLQFEQWTACKGISEWLLTYNQGLTTDFILMSPLCTKCFFSTRFAI